MTAHVDVMELATQMRSADECFALATVVRTVSVTAAKAGAKAVIRPDGTIVAGWIGGGCARGAVLKAARDALSDGQTRLISVQPEELLADIGVKPGDDRDGIRFARNACPSQGTMDIFIEPVLPRPSLVILGASPVAVALSGLAGQFGFQIAMAAPDMDSASAPSADRHLPDFDLACLTATSHYIVISTQGKGDEAALKAALAAPAEYRGFVGSRRKMETLKKKLLETGAEPELVASVKGPAGIDIGAITPEEIALSILSEMIMHRRMGRRGTIASA
jgi:xanthine dehydrogenase accessory factor